MQALPQIVGYKVDVNKVFKISPEPLQIFSESLNKLVDIPIPHSHIGKHPISCRLLSARRRKGMFGERLSEPNIAEQSKYLIIHSHGGGWIANSSKSRKLL
jgi:Hormone-sensitive lipase (HSL) N-terminus